MKVHRTTVRSSPDVRPGGGLESDLAGKVVDLQLAAEELALTAYDDARRARLIGAAKSGVRDLSTNPKYFEGFGADVRP
jgi:hypothetical protein